MKIFSLSLIGILVLDLGACASFPPDLWDLKAPTALVSVALEKDVYEQGGEPERLGILTDRARWDAPLDEAAVLWANEVADGWSRMYPDSTAWKSDTALNDAYLGATTVVALDSWSGLGQPDAVRFKVAPGWNYVGISESSKWIALAKSWSIDALWSIRSAARYVREGSARAGDNESYHLAVRNTVTLLDRDGRPLAEAVLTTYSLSRSFRDFNVARRQLPETLVEAGRDFLKKWQGLIQKE